MKKRKLRILFLDQYFKTPAESGGARTYEMARRWVAGGHEVHVITSSRDEAFARSPRPSTVDGIVVQSIPVPYSQRMGIVQRLRAFFKFAWKATVARPGGQFDVVVATSTPLTIAIPGVVQARRLRAPFVFEVRDLWPELPIAIGALRHPVLKVAARWLERWAYRNAAGVVALSPGMRDGVLRVRQDVETVVVPNACDVALFKASAEDRASFRRERPWLEERALVAYVGTLGKINHVSWLVDVAKELADVAPEARVLIVGDGNDREAVVARARELGVLGANLHIESTVSRDQTPSILAGADMACSLFADIPEMQANSANKFFDALAAGRPVLLNYGGWQADLVRDAGAGLVLWRKSPRETAEAIARALSDASWLAAAGEGSARLGRERFDRDVLSATFLRFLQRVVDERTTVT